MWGSQQYQAELILGLHFIANEIQESESHHSFAYQSTLHNLWKENSFHICFDDFHRINVSI